MTLIRISVAASATLTTVMAFSSPPASALAQAAQQTPLVCLVRQSSAGNERARVVAPATDADALKAKGFVAASCNDPAFDRSNQILFRDQMCRIAADQPEGIQLQFERILGERPAVLCGIAEAALGAWDSSKGVQ